MQCVASTFRAPVATTSARAVQRVQSMSLTRAQARFATMTVRAEPETAPEPAPKAPEEIEMDPESETALKQKKIDDLRAAEKFMTLGDGDADCGGCGYKYEPKKGDPDFPVPKGITYKQLPEDYICPICGAPKDQFKENLIEVAGFEENQGYGLGTNSMTEGDKSKLIYGSLLFFFFVFISGYLLE